MPDLIDTKAECVVEVGRFAKKFGQPNVGLYNHFRGVCVTGNMEGLQPKVREFIEQNVKLCQPEQIQICDGTDAENKALLQLLVAQGTIKKLPKYENCWLALTNPKDVARVEGKTVICTKNKTDTQADQKEGVKNQLANWISPENMDKAIQERFPGCMKGRTMYVIPFSMGPVGSSLSKLGVQLTDSPYVVASMRIMTRMGNPVIELLKNPKQDFVKCLHSVGTPKCGVHEKPSWFCDPERTMIMHKPETNEIVSYGSGYGGNSLLGKKCLALRIGSTIARREGWLAEHMLILGITNPEGKKFYITAAFPSACGKTNLALMTPTLPGYKAECVGDDIAWMKFDETGQLRAINPENGFFGVAPGTSKKTNPIAMATIFKNTIFTNVAETKDGGVYWEGLEDEVPDGTEMTDWLGKPWVKGQTKTPAAHPNSRFCTPANQCPIIDPDWESQKGVPVTAILFGGRRPTGVPLIYESFDWEHGVFIGASMRSEATAAAEFKGKVVMHDPFAMRPFFGYNFGKYLEHWLSMRHRSDKLPRIFHVNWFRKDEQGKFLWPGFGDNSRVIDWILRRLQCDNSIACESPIGIIPNANGLNLKGLNNVDLKQLLAVPKEFWEQEMDDIEKYLDEQIGKDVPMEIKKQIAMVRGRLCLSK